MKKDDQKRINCKFQPKKQNLLLPACGLPPYMYIVCEGVKTEPNYIKAMADEINEKFFAFSQQKRIIVHGTGRNTRSLLEYAREKVKDEMPYAEIVWIVYDKDDFPYDDFDNTQFSAEGRKNKKEYKVAWSNECFELWLMLHFEYLNSSIGREKCIKLLKKYIPHYKKNMKNIYQNVKEKIPTAIKNAKKLYKEYNKLTPPSKRCPATRMYELVEQLQKFL